MSRFVPIARRAVRSYSTSPPAEKTNYAPIFLGAGIAGSALFYYSTLGSAKSTADSKAAELAALLAVPSPKVLPAALVSDEFRNFKLKEIKEFNHNTSTFTFELPEGTTSGLSVASALVVKSATEGLALAKNGKPAVRPYTPVTSPSKEGELELLVKKYPGGVMTTHIHEMKVGESLAIKGPILKFAYKPNEFDTIGLIAGGSGITPMWQIMQAIDANPADKTKAVLVFGNVTEADILLRKEFEDLATRKPEQFKIHFVLDKPPTAWTGLTGYMTSKLLGGTLPAPTENIKLFVCGPPPQVAAISGKKDKSEQGELSGVLAELGYKAEQVYKF